MRSTSRIRRFDFDIDSQDPGRIPSLRTMKTKSANTRSVAFRPAIPLQTLQAHSADFVSFQAGSPEKRQILPTPFESRYLQPYLIVGTMALPCWALALTPPSCSNS